MSPLSVGLIVGIGLLAAIGQPLTAQEPPASVDALIQKLDDPDPTQRFAAAEALGKLGPAAAPAVSKLIGRLGDEAMRQSEEPVTIEDEVWVAATKALAAIGPEAVPELIKALEGDDLQTARAAALSVHFMGPPAKEATGPLIRLLEKDNDQTRRQAILGLAGIGPDAKEAVPLLIKMLHHEDFHTQYQSCRALARMGEGAAPAVPELVGLLSHRITSVRRNSAEALGELTMVAGDDAIAALIKRLEDPIEPVREASVTALGKFGPRAKSAVPALEDLVKRQRLATPTAALLALWRITGESMDIIPKLLAEIDKPDAPWSAAEALAQIKPASGQIVDGLASRLASTDPEARLACAKALGQIGAPARSAEAELKKLLEDEDETIRAAAQEALDRIGRE